MIDLYYWTTPNGHKLTIFLEEAGLPYRILPVNISRGEQFNPAFLKIAPNNRIPAMVDTAPADGGEPIPIFESGAMLLYLAEKSGKFLSADVRSRAETLQWLFWQMAGLGPMLGQTHHFLHYAPEHIPYAAKRYVDESNRLYGVLERRLEGRDFVAGEYSIADMAIYPWIYPTRQGQNPDDFPNVMTWRSRIEARPAVARAYEIAAGINDKLTVHDDEAKRILFGQTAASVHADASAKAVE